MGKVKDRAVAGRYKGDDGDDAAGEAAQISMGPPCMVAAFAIPDEESEEHVIKRANEELAQFKGRMRALNLNVEQITAKHNTLILMKVGAPEPMLKYEAEQNFIRIRLCEEYGGALCRFTQELEDKSAYGKPLDGFPLFNSAQQLSIANFVACSVPYDAAGDGDETDWGAEFDPQAMIEDTVGSQMQAWFPLHHQRNRMKLQFEWAQALTKPQPIPLVKEYFGEKYALFYTWWGYYITMLWLPSLVGLALFVSEAMSYFETGSLENPYKVCYCVFMVVWITGFNALWKNLEKARSYEWDTLNFEEEEDFRQEFKQNKLTEHQSHVNDVTGDLDDYYYDDGTFFPIPTGRARSQALSYGVLAVSVLVVIVANIYIWKMVALPMMQPDNVLTGTLVGASLSSLVTIVLDAVMDGVPQLGTEGLIDILVEDANWDTDTRHEDALIMNTFYFKIFNKYFALVWVAFLANYIEVDGDDVSCPEWQCFPILQVTYLVLVLQGIVANLFQVKVLPIIYKRLFDTTSAVAAAEETLGLVVKTEMELQYDQPKPPAVVDGYMVLIYQLGNVAMFAVVLPIVPLIYLVYSISELRAKALGLLTELRRPEYQCAADIGSYQQVIDIFSTLAVVTNAFIAGFTSHALYFYFPEMDGVERVWATILLEHVLFLCKLLVENVIPKTPKQAQEDYEYAEDLKRKRLEYWGIDDPESY